MNTYFYKSIVILILLILLYKLLVLFFKIDHFAINDPKESPVDCYIGTNLTDADKPECDAKGSQCKFVTLTDDTDDTDESKYCVPFDSDITQFDYNYLTGNQQAQTTQAQDQSQTTQAQDQQTTQAQDQSQTKRSLNEIDFNIIKKGNSSIEIYWERKNINVVKFIIVFFIQNNGPYFVIKDINESDNYFFHTMDNIQIQTEYKIGIIALDNNNTSTPITKFKKFILSSLKDDLKVDYTNYFKNNIICNPNGQHSIVGKCPNDLNNEPSIIALSNDELFDEQKHTQLMNDMNTKTDIKFKLKIL